MPAEAQRSHPLPTRKARDDVGERLDPLTHPPQIHTQQQSSDIGRLVRYLWTLHNARLLVQPSVQYFGIPGGALPGV